MPEMPRVSPAFLSSGTTDREHRTEEVPFEKPVAPIELTALDDANGLIEGPSASCGSHRSC